MHSAVQTKLGLATVTPFTFMDGWLIGMTLKLSFPLLLINSGWLKTLKTSIFNSSAADSHLGILIDFLRETSKRYSGKLCPALRTKLPLKNWKSTGSPV